MSRGTWLLGLLAATSGRSCFRDFSRLPLRDPGASRCNWPGGPARKSRARSPHRRVTGLFRGDRFVFVAVVVCASAAVAVVAGGVNIDVDIDVFTVIGFSIGAAEFVFGPAPER
ncbi:MAG: hypothetical protein ACRD63_05720 [Pyrinomonadaceae bacterium]